MATIAGNVCNTYVHMDLIVTEGATSAENNTSTVSWKLVGYLGSGATAAYWYSNSYHTIEVKINNTTVYSVANTTQKSISIGTNHTQANPLIIASGTTTVPHNSDGTKTCACSFSCVYRYDSKFTWNGSGNVTLTTIPRATVPTVTPKTVAMKSAVTISLSSRASSSFTHTLTYKCGSATGTIATKTTNTSVSWTVPIALASQIPNDTSVSVTITCTTYSGNTAIGSKTVTITATVPSDIVPTISNIATSDQTSYYATFDGYVQNKSNVKITATASGINGSTIKSYRIVANGSTYTSNGCTTGVLTKSGSNTITVTVTDSRGRTASKTATITVLAYDVPKIKYSQAYRVASTTSTTEADDGAYVYVKSSTTVTDLNSKNKKSVVWHYKEPTASTWTKVTDYRFAADVDKQYNVRMTLSDTVGSIVYVYLDVQSTFSLMDFHSGGKGIAFGKSALADLFSVALANRFAESLRSDKDVIAGLGTSEQVSLQDTGKTSLKTITISVGDTPFSGTIDIHSCGKHRDIQVNITSTGASAIGAGWHTLCTLPDKPLSIVKLEAPASTTTYYPVHFEITSEGLLRVYVRSLPSSTSVRANISYTIK